MKAGGWREKRKEAAVYFSLGTRVVCMYTKVVVSHVYNILLCHSSRESNELIHVNMCLIW